MSLVNKILLAKINEEKIPRVFAIFVRRKAMNSFSQRRGEKNCWELCRKVVEMRKRLETLPKSVRVNSHWNHRCFLRRASNYIISRWLYQITQKEIQLTTTNFSCNLNYASRVVKRKWFLPLQTVLNSELESMKSSLSCTRNKISTKHFRCIRKNPTRVHGKLSFFLLKCFSFLAGVKISREWAFTAKSHEFKLCLSGEKKGFELNKLS